MDSTPYQEQNDRIQHCAAVDSRALPTAIAESSSIQDGPYSWTPFRKNLTLFLIFMGCVIAGLAANIQNPAAEDIRNDLFTTGEPLILTLAVFVLVQGLAALVWCAISEVKGRKLVYLVSFPLFAVASIAIAISNNIGLMIGFRAIQAAGSSAVITIGAATLTDIFESKERGTMMGIYSVAPLLGPALSPIVGGSLTTGLGWRSISWFLSIASGVSWLSFLLFFRETSFRPSSIRHLREKQNVRDDTASQTTTIQASTVDLNYLDLEKAEKPIPIAAGVTQPPIQLPVESINPLKHTGAVLRCGNNLAILLACGILFALNYIITYTGARTLAAFYQYNPLMIGVITITYGLGCMFGSLLGGRWSDYMLAKNRDKTYPEMRLKSTTPAVILLPPCAVGFGWACKREVHIAALCALLFMTGFFIFWISASAFLYLTDANAGQKTAAIAGHAAFRGVFASISIGVVVPMRNALGDGWLYTVWGFATVLSGSLIALVLWKGECLHKSAREQEFPVQH